MIHWLVYGPSRLLDFQPLIGNIQCGQDILKFKSTFKKTFLEYWLRGYTIDDVEHDLPLVKFRIGV